ncbi:MAG: ABC transporter permease [Candidatus Omnitrophica bacterium]|nr:ABC transporter permease [Candidatus Omnitrophota bacterium]
MSVNRIYAVVLRQYYLLRGSPVRVLPLVIWVAIDIILWGFMTRYLSTITAPGFQFVSSILGAVLLWDFFIRIMQGVTMAFFEDVWSRNFLNFFATPLTIVEYLAGLVLSSILTSSIGVVVMVALASVVFGLSFSVYGLMLVPFFLFLFLFGIAFGIFACTIMLRFGPAAEWLILPIPAMPAPFVGVFYPVKVLPVWMQYVGQMLPPSYIFEGMRTVVNGGGVPLIDLVKSGVLVILYLAAACWCFKQTYQHAVRTGLIARYSAENLG